MIYGPGAVEEGYARFQRRYVVCTVLCSVLVITWLVMEVTLEPYLDRLRMETFTILPGLVYLLVLPPLGFLAMGCLIPAFASLWADMRVRSVRARGWCWRWDCWLLAYHLLWMTGILNLWPGAFTQCYPLRLWFATLSTAGNECCGWARSFLSGGLLFLALNR
ncbi:MAG: hypothetical protein V8R40_12025 [Dysosmobacter sp.]